VYSVTIRSQLIYAVHCVLSIPENTLHIFVENNFTEKYVIPCHGEACLENRAHADICFITFSTLFFYRESRYGELVSEFHFVLYIHLSSECRTEPLYCLVYE
jgi:hypothetical protein